MIGVGLFLLTIGIIQVIAAVDLGGMPGGVVLCVGALESVLGLLMVVASVGEERDE